MLDSAKIEREHEDQSKAIFRLVSRNTTLETYRATEEELLQEVVDELKDLLEEDLLEPKARMPDYLFECRYPRFKKAVDEKAVQFKQKKHGYREICCLPSFALGLVMASRVQSHFKHAPWFKVGHLGDMVDVYGTVSKLVET